MNAAVFAFRRYEDASLRYTGIDSHEGLTHVGGYDTVIAKEFEDGKGKPDPFLRAAARSEEHTSELQSLMRISYAVFCLKKKINKNKTRQCTHERASTQS